MAATKKQIEANQRNAKKSTGPVTPIGKAKSSTNALKHGVLSNKLILPGENLEEYQLLFDGLVSSINPSGALEYSIVEKIAINLWKQRRLIQAETAEINLLNRPERIAKHIHSLLDYPSIHVSADEIEGLDEEYCAWCEAVAPEFKSLERLSVTESIQLKTAAPTLFQELKNDAAEEGLDIDEFITEYFDSVYGYIKAQKNYCAKYQRRTEVAKLADWERNTNSVLRGEAEKRHSRYQTTLHNEFHKLINTLRDLKKMQSHFIEGEATEIKEDNKNEVTDV